MTNLTANLRSLARAVVDEIASHLHGAAPVLDTPPLCVVRGPRPHAATDGRLCRFHLEELGKWLRDIQTEARRIDPAPSLAIRYGAGGGGLASQQSPVVLDAVVYTDPRTTAHGWRHHGPVCLRCPTLLGRRCTCPPAPEKRRTVHWSTCAQHGIHPSCVNVLADRDERGTERLVSVLAVLHELAQRVRDERMLGLLVQQIVVRVPPGYEGVYVVEPDGTIGATTLVPAAPTLQGEREVLTRNLDWIAAQPWVTEMRRQIADLRDQLLRANQNEDDQPLQGHCYKLVDGEECGGDLWPAKPVHSSGYETAEGFQAVVCGRNDTHRWEGSADLARLSVITAQQSREDTAS